MTPKEKALSLIEKYETLIVMWTGGVEVERQNVKQCALITVEEIIKSLIEFDEILDIDVPISNEIDFWNQVKMEINKLYNYAKQE